MGDEHHDPRKQVYAADQRHQNFWGKVTPWEVEDPISAEAPEAYEQRQRNELRDGLTFRAGVAMPGTYYLSRDHEQLKKMVTDNVDINAAHEIGHVWNDLGNILVGVHTDLRNAVNSSADAWQGVAADEARKHISGMADTVGVNAKACQYAGNSIAQQADAVAQATRMPEPVNFSMLDAMKMVATEPNPFKMPQVIGQIQQKFDQKQQAHAEAAQMMTTMETSMGQALSTMPAFVAEPPPSNQPPENKPPLPVDDLERRRRPGAPGVAGNTPFGTFSGPRYTGTGQPAPASMPPPSGQPVPGVQPPHAPPQPAPVWHPGDQTNSQGAGGGQGGAPSPGYPGGGSLGGRPGAGGTGGGATGGVVPLGPIGSGGLGGSVGGSEGVRAGRGGAVGGLGSGAEGSARAGHGGPGTGRGPGGMLGIGGTPGEGGVAGRGAAGAAGAGGRAGTPGAMMGGGAGGAAGKGEDAEHQRPSYLVEADPESTFGTDQMVAPPVIGE